MRRHLVAPAAAALAIAAASLCTADGDIFGINPTWGDWVQIDPDTYDPAMMDKIVQAGGTCMRSGFDWCNMETAPGVYVWDEYDSRVDLCVARGIEWIGLICVTPAWASPTGQHTHQWPPLPEYTDEFEDFCYNLAVHYAGRVTRYEFWNEANNCGWHQPGRYDEYTPWLIRAYDALKAGDPNCLVSTTGLDGGDTNFLEGIYSCGGGDYFDAVALHPYSGYGISESAIQNIRAVMVSHGDADKPIWLTEYGWSSEDPTYQNNCLVQALSALTSGAYDYVTHACYHTISDWDPSGSPTMGLCTRDLVPRQAWYTFRDWPRPDPPIISNVATEALSAHSVEITWDTDIPATSQVEYGTTESYGEWSPLDEMLVTGHSVTLGGLLEASVYHFRVHSGAPGYDTHASDDGTFQTLGGALANPGFESGFWELWDGHYYSYIGQGWSDWGGYTKYDGANDGRAHTGAHSQAIWTDWGPSGEEGGVYQTVSAVPGAEYALTAWALGRDGYDNGGANLISQIGIDPTGGSSATSPDVVWSAPVWYSSSVPNGVWHQHSVSAAAAGSGVTVFLKMETGQPHDHNVYFDDVVLAGPAVETTTLPAGWSLISIPLAPLDTAASAVLDGCIAAGNALEGNLYRYGSAGYDGYPAGMTHLQPGCGYWLRLDIGCAEDAVGQTAGSDVDIALADGWSLIGHPHTAPQALADCTVDDGVGLLGFDDAVAAGWLDGVLYRYEDGYETVRTDGTGAAEDLDPWKGYWVLANRPGLQLIVPRP